MEKALRSRLRRPQKSPDFQHGLYARREHLQRRSVHLRVTHGGRVPRRRARSTSSNFTRIITQRSGTRLWILKTQQSMALSSRTSYNSAAQLFLSLTTRLFVKKTELGHTFTGLKTSRKNPGRPTTQYLDLLFLI